MKRILLLAKHLTPDACQFILKSLNKEAGEIRIAFCQNAADLDNQKDYVAISREELRSQGFTLEDLDLNQFCQKPIEFSKWLAPFDATFFTGGSSLYLNYLFHNCRLVQAYKSLVESGQLMHIGFSAGGMICSPTMKYAKIIDSIDHVPRIYESGLGLVSFYFAPHVGDKEKYTLKYQEACRAYPEEQNILIPLNNQQGIAVIDEDWEII